MISLSIYREIALDLQPKNSLNLITGTKI